MYFLFLYTNCEASSNLCTQQEASIVLFAFVYEWKNWITSIRWTEGFPFSSCFTRLISRSAFTICIRLWVSCFLLVLLFWLQLKQPNSLLSSVLEWVLLYFSWVFLADWNHWGLWLIIRHLFLIWWAEKVLGVRNSREVDLDIFPELFLLCGLFIF